MIRRLAKNLANVSETAIDDEIVVMSLDTGDFFSLTQTARAIWLLIDGSRTRDQLLADLASHYGVSPETIVADVDTFLEQLSAAGLLA